MAGLYVHIPYCRVKCPYCDFNVYGGTTWPEERYVGALVLELRHAAHTEPWKDATIETIFFGGGTPSLFAPSSIGRIISAARDWFPVDPDVEISLEANPGTIDRDGLERLRLLGVNRLSIGIQSFRDRELTTLGRDHTADAAPAAVELARAVGIAVVATDLMFGIPGQSLTDWECNVRHAIALAPDHVSAYGLTYEANTPYHAWRASGRLRPVAEAAEAEMFTETERLLERAGYHHYEISNYARPGRQCRHNLTYWRRQPYLGIGAGAHSFSATRPYGKRWENVRPPAQYMGFVEQRGHAITATEELGRDHAVTEFLFLGLRLLAGIDARRFTALFGSTPEATRPAIGRLVERDLLEYADSRIRLTPTGLLHADSVFAALT